MTRLYQSILIVLIFLASTIAYSESNEVFSDPSGSQADSANTERQRALNSKVIQLVPKSRDQEKFSLTRNKWCVKARFGSASYEYRLHFLESLNLSYSYFHLNPDSSVGDLAQEGEGTWSLSGAILKMLIAEEEQQVKILLEPNSETGHPQLHFNPGTSSMLTFNPCD